MRARSFLLGLLIELGGVMGARGCLLDALVALAGVLCKARPPLHTAKWACRGMNPF